jgi:hypothetical protein
MAVIIAASGRATNGSDDFEQFSASFLTNSAICLFGLTLAALALRNRARSGNAVVE